jgi:NTE family protein
MRWPGHSPGPPRLNLALQGGGAHGAFTWGVLDALLADGRCDFEGLSGSSAGAMNAVVMAQGWMNGGREGARQALADFWREVGEQLPASMVSRAADDSLSLSPASQWWAQWAGHFSPSQLNPLDLNPLRELLTRRVDFERLRAASPFKLFIAATQVRTGKLRIFREQELTAPMLLASACLPLMHHTVEVAGEPYWDGGYSANPAVYPLFYDCQSADILLVLLHPLHIEHRPHSVAQIEARIADLAFSTPFLREMRMFVQAAAFTRSRWLPRGRLARRLSALRFHMIDTTEVDSLKRSDTQLLAHGPFLERLQAQGLACGQHWLAQHAGALGRRSSVDLRALFS